MNTLAALFQYGFILRGVEAGLIVGAVAPLIGIFLVLRRYSLIADTLAHVSLAGIAVGILLGFNPMVGALVAAVLASLGTERLRTSKKVYGESALALFLSGSLALAIVLLSVGGFKTNIFTYLFGSIWTVTNMDVLIMVLLGITVVGTIAAFYKELVYISFDEEAARVSGIRTRTINNILIVLSALVVALSIPTVGVLLIAALVVVPVVAALQLRKSFTETILYAELISIASVLSGVFVSYTLDLSTGGTIVLIMMAIFGVIFVLRRG